MLVTGAAGFIGYHVTLEAAERGWQVLAVDGLLEGTYSANEKLSRFEKLSKTKNVEVVKCDLREKIPSEIADIDYIINLSAMPGLRLSWDDFALYRSCNLDLVANLIEASRGWPLKKFIQASTSSVYGMGAVGGESQALRPVSPYGVTKLSAEMLLDAHHQAFGFPYSTLRYFSVYGPEQRPDMAFRKIIEQALANEPVTVFGDGTQSRTNTFVEDVATVTVDALEKAEVGETYNICGDDEHTLLDSIKTILNKTQSNSSIVHGNRVPGDQGRTAGDNSKAKESLGFAPSTSLEEGIRRQVDWILSRKP